jgi:diphosphomevalonate decarboxylase
MPSLLYWTAGTVTVLQAVRTWRRGGLEVYFTLDAGPNVHCLCEAKDAVEVERRLRNLRAVGDVLASGVGEGVRLVAYQLF